MRFNRRTGLVTMLAAGALAVSAAAALAVQGDLDTTFSADGKLVFDVTDGRANGVAVDSQGRTVAAGSVDPTGGDTSDFAVARFTAKGDPDATFSGDGIVTLDASAAGLADQARAVAIDNQGRIYLAGSADTGGDLGSVVARFTETGVPDSGFDVDGVSLQDFDPANDDSLDDVVADSTGRPVAAGSSGAAATSDFLVARLTTAGGLDSSFGGGDSFETLNIGAAASQDTGSGVTLDSVARVLVAGSTNAVVDEDDFAAARFSKDGVLDGGWGTGGNVVVPMSSEAGTEKKDQGLDIVAIAGDKALVSGYAEVTGSGEEMAILQLSSGGQPDATFSSDGKLTFGFGASADRAEGITIDGAGNVVLAGPAGTQFGVARLTPAGVLDVEFEKDGLVATDVGGGDDNAQDVAIDQKTRKIVVAGFTGPAATADWALARYEGVARCGKKAPTIVGTADKDTLNGTPKKDVIAAGDGHDTVRGIEQGDVVCGEEGNDRLVGGPGKDELLGGEGNDQIIGGKGADKLNGGKGNDKLKGNKGRDVLLGGPGNDTLKGGKGADTLKGGPGKDKSKGGPGRDSVKK